MDTAQTTNSLHTFANGSGQSVLVTGGTGFIGRPLVHLLVQQGFRVTVLSRQGHSKTLLPASVRCITSLCHLEGDAQIPIVINLAGEGIADRRWTARRRKQLFDSRIGLTESLFHSFESRPAPDILLSASAIGFYGSHQDEWLDEQGKIQHGFAHHLCYEWELAATAFEALGTRVCQLRFGVVLGPNGGMLKRLLTPFRLGLGGRLGHGRQWLSWVHREDVIAAIMFCLSHQTLSGPVNVTAPQPVRNRDFTRSLAKLLKRPALLPMPEPIVQLLFGEMGEELLLSGQRVVPGVLESSGFSFRYRELDQALKACLLLS